MISKVGVQSILGILVVVNFIYLLMTMWDSGLHEYTNLVADVDGVNSKIFVDTVEKLVNDKKLNKESLDSLKHLYYFMPFMTGERFKTETNNILKKSKSGVSGNFNEMKRKCQNETNSSFTWKHGLTMIWNILCIVVFSMGIQKLGVEAIEDDDEDVVKFIVGSISAYLIVVGISLILFAINQKYGIVIYQTSFEKVGNKFLIVGFMSIFEIALPVALLTLITDKFSLGLIK